MTNITMVVTSCNRHDLLKRTLDSFVSKADLYPDTTIVVEDSSASKPEWLGTIPELGQMIWLSNNTNIGQILSIDRAYSLVNTDYIFHCEDDWLFIEGDFMQKSMDVLNGYPEIIMVALTGIHKVEDPRFPFPIAEPGFEGVWNGLTFNPGLRRLEDYRKIGGAYHPHGFESALSLLYLKQGRVMAQLGRYVQHIGYDRSTMLMNLPNVRKRG